MKKLITLLLIGSSFAGMAQKSLQNVGQVGNIYHVRGELQADSLVTVKQGFKTLKLKNNVSEDSIFLPNSSGLWHGILKSTLGAGGGITQDYADTHYMPLVTTLGAYNTAFGTTSGTTAQGNDSRILDGETAFGWGNHALVGYYKSSNFIAGTNYVAPNGSAAGLTSFPTFNQNTTGTAANVTGIIALNHGGTGSSFASTQALLDGILPSQTGNNGRVLTTNGTTATWQAPAGGGGTGITGISFSSSNGFNGAATTGATPVVTLGTYLIGLLKGNGTAMSVAAAGTDYSAGTASLASGLLKNTNGTGNFVIATPGTDYLTALSGDGTTSGNVFTLNTVNSNVGEFNTITFNAKGLATSARNVSYLTANQSVTLHSTGGDVAIGSTSGTTDINATLTLNNNSVTIGKLQQVAQNHIFFRTTSGTGNFEDHTLADLKAALNLDQTPNLTAANMGISTAQAAVNALKAPIDAPVFTTSVTLPNTPATNAELLTDDKPMFTLGGGTGITNDTLYVTTATIYGSVFAAGADNFVITKMNVVLQGSSPSVTVDVKFGTSLNSGGTSLVVGGTAVTSTTTGTNVTVFNNATIPANNFIWMKTPTVVPGSKPTYIQVTLIGHKVRN